MENKNEKMKIRQASGVSHDNLLARVSENTLERMIDVLVDVAREMDDAAGDDVRKYGDDFYLDVVHLQLEAMVQLNRKLKSGSK